MKKSLLLVALVLLAGGTALVVLGGRELADTLSRRSGTTVTAFVTEKSESTDVVRGVRVPSYDIRYRFELGDTAYTAGDATGRTDLAVGVPEAQWRDLEVGDPVEVAYATDNPANNRPAESSGSLADPVAGLVLGLLLVGAGVVALLARRPRREPVAPTPAAVGTPPPPTVVPPTAVSSSVAPVEPAGPRRSAPQIDTDDPAAVLAAVRDGLAHLHGGPTSEEGWVVRFEDGEFVRRSWRGVVESSDVLRSGEVKELLRRHGPGIVVPDPLD